MDTTPEYILMSEKALRDLAEFHPHIQCEEVPHRVNIVEIDYNGNWWFNRDNKVLVPLFRQDQLQEIIGENTGFRTQINLLDNMLSKCVSQIGYGLTWEEVWLRIVMKKKYNKVWNGKDWVKK